MANDDDYKKSTVEMSRKISAAGIKFSQAWIDENHQVINAILELDGYQGAHLMLCASADARALERAAGKAAEALEKLETEMQARGPAPTTDELAEFRAWQKSQQKTAEPGEAGQ
ncbi:MAG TPA: hypothetical protein VGG25_11610 [Streptosporangiaceae bacterium]|jgi:hypothetical protein